MNHLVNSNITFEQLLVFVAVSEHGGVNSAAEHIHKSPSAISHALKKLQSQLDLALFRTEGRQLRLTHQGTQLLTQAKQLLNDRYHFIEQASYLQQNEKNHLSIAFDAIFPFHYLSQALQAFAKVHPHCHITLKEDILSGVEEQLIDHSIDIAINYRTTKGFLGESILDVPFLPVAAPNHPLVQQSAITSRELSQHRQVVISDSGRHNRVDSGWLKSKQRWSVSNLHSAIEVVKSGMAFTWLPKHLIADDLKSGRLCELDIRFGKVKEHHLYMILKDDRCNVSQTMGDCIKDALANPETVV